jgi:hypothetical protein
LTALNELFQVPRTTDILNHIIPRGATLPSFSIVRQGLFDADFSSHMKWKDMASMKISENERKGKK